VSIKAKQVAGVTTLVVVIVAILSAYHLATLARLSLGDAAARGEMLAQAVFQRAHGVSREAGGDPYKALRDDGGVRAILQSAIGYSPTVLYAAIVNPEGIAIAHSFLSLEGRPMDRQGDLNAVVTANPLEQLRAVYSDQTFEVRSQILAGDQMFAEIRIGISTVLVRDELEAGLQTAIGTIIGALIISSLMAMLLSQWMLRPIHVIQSGLTRLGRGELDVRLDLPEQEFKDLGSSFDAVSAQISALGRAGASATTSRPGASTDLESVMDSLEDAVALFSPGGELIFTNTAMKALLSESGADAIGETLSVLPDAHPVKQLVERTLAGRTAAGPLSVSSMTLDARAVDRKQVDEESSNPEPAERLLMSHAIEDTSGRFLGAMLVARNIGYLSQVQSTLNYSRKLAALGRLMAGVAHEVKNPLNAMTIHLELLKQKMNRAQPVAAVGGRLPDGVQPPPDLNKHVTVIGDEIRRLDEVVAGFLKFVRPDELRLQPVNLGVLMSDVATTVGPEAAQRGVTLRSECSEDLPDINADPGMLQQALLNLALNACQAMPNGGTLRLACYPTSRHRVQLEVQDTGVGIPPEDLGRIFDLYFTTKERGSGIGLSMVYRIIQMHDGEVEVESTPGAGTTFKLVFPQA
jgi:signal transduction histidine kinase